MQEPHRSVEAAENSAGQEVNQSLQRHKIKCQTTKVFNKGEAPEAVGVDEDNRGREGTLKMIVRYKKITPFVVKNDLLN